MTEQQKIDAAVAKAVKEVEEKAKADREAAVKEARADAAEEAKALAQADADADKAKAVEEARAQARAEANAEADKRIEGIIEDANRSISDARASGAATAARGGRSDKLRHFVTTEVQFIAGSLLAPGSRVTSDDLGQFRDPVSGDMRAVEPARSMVEVDANGQPIDDLNAAKMQGVVGDFAGVPIAAVQPFSPNPTRPQGAPTQPPGGVSLADNALHVLPPEGVESNAAAAARAEQADASSKAVQAITAGEAPKRRK